MINVAKPYLGEDEAKAAYHTILSGWVTQGPKVAEFEEKFARYVGSQYAVAVSSCTTALHLALIAAGIKSGDEVICPSMSFIATGNAVRYVNAHPVFAEVGEDFNIDPVHAESLINKKTKAILIVHQIGMPASIDHFRELCKKHSLILIEDAACAIGSTYKTVRIGAHSDLVCFSFHPRKVITTGEGGMIATSHRQYMERIKTLRQHAMSVNDVARHNSSKIIFEEYNELGYNFRMTDIQAAIGIKQLEKLDWIIAERRKIAKAYNEGLKEIECLSLPIEKQDCFSNYQSYAVILKEKCRISRDALMQKLLDLGISTRRGIMLMHREPAYREISGGLSLPISEKLSDRSIILPLYVPMKKEDIDLVINTLKSLLKN